jgi:hypothetical protein
MFTKESGQEGGDPQSWYGKPQHEEVDGDEWEAEYYGEAHEESLERDIEFIPEVEYPAEFVGKIPRVVGRRLRPLFVG